MDDFLILLIVPIFCIVVSGPVALIIAIIALNKTRELFRQLPQLPHRIPDPDAYKARPEPEVSKPKQPIVPSPVAVPVPVKPCFEIKQDTSPIKTAQTFEKKQAAADQKETRKFEQVIGSQWVLIAGIIAVIVGVGFFLKYAYDNSLVGPVGRVVITTLTGLVALVAGEITRRRGYGIVAKGVSSLGFAILYAAVFSAFRFYHLIGSTTTFMLAILVTLAAMLYAVSLNEILIAVISLIGGFLTPVLVSTGDNLPVPLFCYVFILGAGAMLCAWYRKWPAVNLLAFVGTVVLYTGWFEKFFRRQLSWEVPEQMAIAIGGLGVFFAMYLILPLFNGLVNKWKAQKEDVVLVLSNAAMTFYYLWTMLYPKYRIELAFCAIGLCIAHLGMMSIVLRRCKEDIKLRLVLLVVGLFFLTIAVPLYLKLYTVSMAWAAEAIVLTIIGLRYRSFWTQGCAGIAFLLSVAQLADELPMHSAAFVFVLNAAFIGWLFVALAAVVCHILYRTNKWMIDYYRDIISQMIYVAACFLLMLTLAMEWFWHCEYNMLDKTLGETFQINGFMLLFTALTVLLVYRPICPKGLFCKRVGVCVAFAGSAFAVYGLTESYHSCFVIFANINFAFALLFVAGLFAAAWCLKQSADEKEKHPGLPYVFAIAGVFVLWVLLSEEVYLYWQCRDRYSEGVANWRFLANMYMSVLWAVYGAFLMLMGFWRKIALLRYLSLGLFGALLLKVFILDMSTVKSVYRIAAFLATGVTLVGVSYLYQFLIKRGFFDTLIEAKRKD